MESVRTIPIRKAIGVSLGSGHKYHVVRPYRPVKSAVRIKRARQCDVEPTTVSIDGLRQPDKPQFPRRMGPFFFRYRLAHKLGKTDGFKQKWLSRNDEALLCWFPRLAWPWWPLVDSIPVLGGLKVYPLGFIAINQADLAARQRFLPRPRQGA